MKREDITALIEKNRPCIEAAMREADLNAYLNTSFKYEIHLLSDGSTETRERLASDDWWRSEDPSICEIACYCHQYYDALEDDMDLPHLLLVLLEPENLKFSERHTYNVWLRQYKEQNGEYPDNYERRDWLKKNTEAYERAYSRHVEELVAETNYDEQITDLIGDLLDWEDVGNE